MAADDACGMGDGQPALFEKHGYALTLRSEEAQMVGLTKSLAAREDRIIG